MKPFSFLTLMVALIVVGTALSTPASCARKVIISTDIGDDIDDAFALVFALNSPELEVDAVIASYAHTFKKAKLVQKLLHIAGRDDIPVLIGKHLSNDDSKQLRWAADWKPRNLVSDGPRALARRIMRSSGKVTLIPYGALTDIAEVMKIEPKVKDHIDEIILMGGAAYREDARKSQPHAEWNIRCDVKAAQKVFESGVPIVMVGLEVTSMMNLNDPEMTRIKKCQKPLVQALYQLYKAWGHRVPTMYDPVAVAVAFQRDLVKMEYDCVKVTDDGITRIVPGGKPNAYVCTEVDKQRFMDLFMTRILK